MIGASQPTVAEEVRVPREVQRPPVRAGHTVAELLPAGAVAFQVTVLELETSPVRGLGDEAHLDLAGDGGVGLDLPLRTDVPAEHHPLRWVEHEDARPPALAAIGSAVVDVPTDPRFEDSLCDGYAEQVVLTRLEVAAETLGLPSSFRLRVPLPSGRVSRRW